MVFSFTQDQLSTLPQRFILSGPEAFNALQQGAALLLQTSIERIQSGLHTDVLMLQDSGASIAVGNGTEEDPRMTARGIVEWCSRMPTEGSKRVVLLEQCERLTIPAANALLKLIEEPPSYVQLLFSTTNEYQLLETIRSRMTVWRTESSVTEVLLSEEAQAFVDKDIITLYPIIEIISKQDNARHRANTLVQELLLYSRIYTPHWIPALWQAQQNLRTNITVRLILERLILSLH